MDIQIIAPQGRGKTRTADSIARMFAAPQRIFTPFYLTVSVDANTLCREIVESRCDVVIFDDLITESVAAALEAVRGSRVRLKRPIVGIYCITQGHPSDFSSFHHFRNETSIAGAQDLTVDGITEMSIGTEYKEAFEEVTGHTPEELLLMGNVGRPKIVIDHGNPSGKSWVDKASLLGERYGTAFKGAPSPIPNEGKIDETVDWAEAGSLLTKHFGDNLSTLRENDKILFSRSPYDAQSYVTDMVTDKKYTIPELDEAAGLMFSKLFGELTMPEQTTLLESLRDKEASPKKYDGERAVRIKRGKIDKVFTMSELDEAAGLMYSKPFVTLTFKEQSTLIDSLRDSEPVGPFIKNYTLDILVEMARTVHGSNYPSEGYLEALYAEYKIQGVAELAPIHYADFHEKLLPLVDRANCRKICTRLVKKGYARACVKVFNKFGGAISLKEVPVANSAECLANLRDLRDQIDRGVQPRTKRRGQGNG